MTKTSCCGDKTLAARVAVLFFLILVRKTKSHATQQKQKQKLNLLESRNVVTDDGFQVGGLVDKDMDNEDYTEEFNPSDYQPPSSNPDFFPGMAPFTDPNIVEGNKDPANRLIASFWDDLGDDVFDDWGYFYLYDVETGKYFFPLIDPQNQADGVLTLQTFNAFGRTFTINQGWCVQGIFKMDITVNDEKPFIFGAYGNMGSDSSTAEENLSVPYTKNGTALTLYYHHNFETGGVEEEQLYSYFVPKRTSQNSSQTYKAIYDSNDDLSLLSNEVNNGLIVYFAKQFDVKDWVLNDLTIV
jgi:hypothetical protein